MHDEYACYDDDDFNAVRTGLFSPVSLACCFGQLTVEHCQDVIEQHLHKET